MDNSLIIPVNNDHAHGVIEQLGRHFNATLRKDCQQEVLEFPATIATTGKCYAYSISDGIDVLIIDATFKQPVILDLQGGFPAPLKFYTQVNGHLSVSSPQQQFKLRPLQCTIFAGFTDAPIAYRIASGERVTTMITMIHKKKFFKAIDCEELDLPEELLSTISSMSRRKDSFLFQDIYHLPAIDAVKEILEQGHIGMLNSAFATAKVFENLYFQLRRYKESSHEHTSKQQFQEQAQLAKVQNAEQILLSRLLDPPTIPELARMVGTNQQYLKQGFREAYGKTINQYINDHRLEQAGMLIQGGKLSLAEVAAEVGYNSAGYFTRRFKDKYGVAPKNFTKEKFDRRKRKEL